LILLASPYGEAFILDVLQLRETLECLLGASPSLIGVYTLPNGSTLPAVYVVGQKGVPKEWKATGMEVSIGQYPRPLPTPGVGIVDLLQEWEVVLTQYNPDGTEIAQAMDRMVRRFPDADFRYLRGDDVAYERCRVMVMDRVIRRLIV
jgi:hypothetical protein